MIIWVASFPRSGNSFVMSLLWSLYECRTSSVFDETGYIDERKLYAMYGYEKLTFAKFAYWMHDQKPHFVKTHNACVDSLPAIYVIRDGRDTLVSLAHFSIAQKRVETNFEDTLRDCIVVRGFSWSRRVLWWTKKRASFAPTIAVKYEDLIRAPVITLYFALRRLNISSDKTGTPISFETLHNIEPTQYRSGKVGTWRTEMSKANQKLFWQLHGNAMRELGYD